MANKIMQSAMCDYNEASAITGLKISRLKYEVSRRKVPFVKIGRSVFFHREELLSWVLSFKVKSNQSKKTIKKVKAQHE